MHSTKDSVDITQQNLPGDVSLDSAVKGKYLFDTTEAELQPRSLPKETKGFLNINEQSENVELSYSLRVNSEICVDSAYIYFVL